MAAITTATIGAEGLALPEISAGTVAAVAAPVVAAGIVGATVYNDLQTHALNVQAASFENTIFGFPTSAQLVRNPKLQELIKNNPSLAISIAKLATTRDVVSQGQWPTTESQNEFMRQLREPQNTYYVPPEVQRQLIQLTAQTNQSPTIHATEAESDETNATPDPHQEALKAEQLREARGKADKAQHEANEAAANAAAARTRTVQANQAPSNVGGGGISRGPNDPNKPGIVSKILGGIARTLKQVVGGGLKLAWKHPFLTFGGAAGADIGLRAKVSGEQPGQAATDTLGDGMTLLSKMWDGANTAYNAVTGAVDTVKQGVQTVQNTAGNIASTASSIVSKVIPSANAATTTQTSNPNATSKLTEFTAPNPEGDVTATFTYDPNKHITTAKVKTMFDTKSVDVPDANGDIPSAMQKQYEANKTGFFDSFVERTLGSPLSIAVDAVPPPTNVASINDTKLKTVMAQSVKDGGTAPAATTTAGGNGTSNSGTTDPKQPQSNPPAGTPASDPKAKLTSCLTQPNALGDRTSKTILPEDSNAKLENPEGVCAFHFEYDKAKQPTQAEALANAKALRKWLDAHPGQVIHVIGGCDTDGTSEYNKALGMRRANASIQALLDTNIIKAKELVPDSNGKAILWKDEQGKVPENRYAVMYGGPPNPEAAPAPAPPVAEGPAETGPYVVRAPGNFVPQTLPPTMYASVPIGIPYGIEVEHGHGFGWLGDKIAHAFGIIPNQHRYGNMGALRSAGFHGGWGGGARPGGGFRMGA